MVETHIYRDIKTVFDNLNSIIENKELESLNPRDAISRLTLDDKGIKVYDDPNLDSREFKPIHESATDIHRKVKDIPYDYAYGLDGSTTRDMRYNNGLILSASVAGISAMNREKMSEIQSRSSTCISAYFGDTNLNMNNKYIKDNKKITIKQYPQLHNHTSDLPSWVYSMGRTYAEGELFEWVSEDIDQPLFVDGPLIPTQHIIWMMYNKMNSSFVSPIQDWETEIKEIVKSYITGINNCVMNNIPVFGVQKTTVGTRVIDSIIEKSSDLEAKDIPWNNDSILFTHALSLTNQERELLDGSIISYTPWYVEKNIEIGNEKVVPLEGYTDINMKYGSAEDYLRDFFYVKTENKKTVYRVGVPRLLFEKSDYTREQVRYIALKEMSRQNSEPLPILLADKKVRISKEQKKTIQQIINLNSNIDRNEERFGY